MLGTWNFSTKTKNADICQMEEKDIEDLSEPPFGSKVSLGSFSNEATFFLSLPQGAPLYLWNPPLSLVQYLHYRILWLIFYYRG